MYVRDDAVQRSVGIAFVERRGFGYRFVANYLVLGIPVGNARECGATLIYKIVGRTCV